MSVIRQVPNPGHKVTVQIEGFLVQKGFHDHILKDPSSRTGNNQNRSQSEEQELNGVRAEVCQPWNQQSVPGKLLHCTATKHKLFMILQLQQTIANQGLLNKLTVFSNTGTTL